MFAEEFGPTILMALSIAISLIIAGHAGCGSLVLILRDDMRSAGLRVNPPAFGFILVDFLLGGVIVMTLCVIGPLVFPMYVSRLRPAGFRLGPYVIAWLILAGLTLGGWATLIVMLAGM